MTRRRRRNGQFAPKASAKPFTPTANPAYAEAMRGLRASGAAGTHQDKRTRRANTRSAAERRALDDQDS